MALWFILFGIISGVGKAVRDDVSHHWNKSIFSLIKNKNTRDWFESKKEKPKHKIWFMWDSWHCGDVMSYLGAVLTMTAFWQEFHPYYILVYIMMFGITFNLCYHKLFTRKFYGKE